MSDTDKKNRFRIINSILFEKNYSLIDEPDFEREYNPFFINRSLSYHRETIEYAVKMNRASLLPKKYQFLYLINIVRKKKLFAKFARKSGGQKFDDLKLIQEFFQYNSKRAAEALSILTNEQIELIRERSLKGGIDNG